MAFDVALRKMTISGQVAVVLLAGESVLPLFRAQPQTRRVIEAALAAGWSWLARRVPDAGALYWDHSAALSQEELKYHGDQRRLAAIHACMYMHRYVVWQAERVARVEQPTVKLSVGNDIDEVDERYFHDCLEHAVRAAEDAAATESWLASIVATVDRECVVVGRDVVGRAPRREQLTKPPSLA